MANLSGVLKNSSAQEFHQTVVAAAYEVRRSFSAGEACTENLDQAEERLASYYQDLIAKIEGAEVDLVVARGAVHIMITQSMGLDNASAMIRLDIGGGIYGLADKVTDTVVEHQRKLQVDGAIASGVDPSSHEDLLDFARQYLTQSGRGWAEAELDEKCREMASRVIPLLENRHTISKTLNSILHGS
jgi:hypothetical protein